MGDVEDALDLDRLKNLTTGFGWRVSKTETMDDRLIVTLEKSRVPSTETEGAPPT